MSFLCGTATSIDQMIVYRALQGFIGGGMIPTVFAAAFTIFPRSKQPIISPMIGLVATLAPTIGPTVGGYLTDLFSWHWLFFVNVVPGIVVTIMAVTMIDFDEPDLSLFEEFRLARADHDGHFSRLPRICARGRTQPMTGSTIARSRSAPCSASPAPCCSSGGPSRRASRSSTCAPSRTRNFASGSVFSFVMGIGLYGLTYLYPLYLARVRGYDALMIGETMFVTGACMFLDGAGRRQPDAHPRSPG